eukprot:CCRYP_001049-RA/>CCRYP_001049-RA protein AED:0.05 eAED:0.05 QI:0/0/0.5/1/0/0/2/284/426
MTPSRGTPAPTRTNLPMLLLLLSLSHPFATGFTPPPNIQGPAIPTALPSTSSFSASDLLYQDQQNALLRRALHEQTLLTSQTPTIPPLTSAKVKGVTTSGTGFASSSSSSPSKTKGKNSSASRLAASQARIVQKDGVIRIDSALSDGACEALRRYVLEQQRLAEEAVNEYLHEGKDVEGLCRIYYGVENRRVGRCDLQLSLLRGGFVRDWKDSSPTSPLSSVEDMEDFPLMDALVELLGEKGTLRHLYEQLVTPQGEFYELAAVITDPGSRRQTIHPDLPWKPIAPLYVIFVALQDVTVEMGPTCFLLGTHTEEVNELFNCGDVAQKDEVIKNANGRLSTLKRGDCVLFDARTLHCGNANESTETRALFNFSFRNPRVTGDLGYKGSMRPGYEKAMTLKDVHEALNAYEGGDGEPFARYGNDYLVV